MIRKRKNFLENYIHCNNNKTLLKRRVITESYSYKNLFDNIFLIAKQVSNINKKIKSFEVAEKHISFLGKNTNDSDSLIYIKLNLVSGKTIVNQFPSDDTYLYVISDLDNESIVDAIKININDINLSAKKLSEWIDYNY